MLEMYRFLALNMMHGLNNIMRKTLFQRDQRLKRACYYDVDSENDKSASFGRLLFLLSFVSLLATVVWKRI